MHSQNKITSINQKKQDNILINIKHKTLNARWDEEVYFIANELSLPLTSCLLNFNLKILNFSDDNYRLGDIVHGLGYDWSLWERTAEACLLKVSLGITAESVDDVYSQMTDISNEIGRAPVSKEEFHGAKESLFRRQFEEMEFTYEEKLEVSASKTKDIIQTLNKERAEKHNLIEQLETSYHQILKLQEDNSYIQYGLDMGSYVKIELLEKITEQLELTEAKHEDVISFYLDKINNIEHNNSSERIVSDNIHNQLLESQEKIKNLNAQLTLSDPALLGAELLMSKNKIVDLLKSTIALKKKNNLLTSIKSYQSKNIKTIKGELDSTIIKSNKWELFGKLFIGVILVSGFILSFVIDSIIF
jgi:hypothetical protein